MRVALPDILSAEPLVSVLEAEGVAVGRGPSHEALGLLLDGSVDVALVPTLTALRRVADVDVMPGVALSTWDYPFARVVLKNGFERPVRTLAVDPAYAQEAFLAHLLLTEHYGQTVELVAHPHPGLAALETHDAVLAVGNDAALLHAQMPDAVVLDLGQEWYELANYPMVWGLFVTRKGEAEMRWRQTLLAAVKTVEEQQALWLRAREMPEVLHAYFAESVRFRFDDLAVAGLTELRDYLFQRGALEEVSDLPIAELPDEDDDEASPEGPLL